MPFETFTNESDNLETDFSSAGQRYMYVVDNLGVHFIIDTQTRTRYRLAGPGSRNAAAILWGTGTGPVHTGVYLSNWDEPISAIDLYGGPNAMERVIAGWEPDPLTGEMFHDPQTVVAGDGTTFEAPSFPGEGDDEAGEGEDVADPVPRDFFEEARTLMPWMPEDLVRIFADHWSETGSREIALARTRQDPLYDRHFPGIKREDGTLRMSEQEYFSTLEAYKDYVSGYGLPPDWFEDKYVNLIAGEVSAQEFRHRLDLLYTNILSNLDEIRSFYEEHFGIEGMFPMLGVDRVGPAVGDGSGVPGEGGSGVPGEDEPGEDESEEFLSRAERHRREARVDDLGDPRGVFPGFSIGPNPPRS